MACTPIYFTPAVYKYLYTSLHAGGVASSLHGHGLTVHVSWFPGGGTAGVVDLRGIDVTPRTNPNYVKSGTALHGTPCYC